MKVGNFFLSSQAKPDVLKPPQGPLNFAYVSCKNHHCNHEVFNKSSTYDQKKIKLDTWEKGCV